MPGANPGWGICSHQAILNIKKTLSFYPIKVKLLLRVKNFLATEFSQFMIKQSNERVNRALFQKNKI
jgi:hypothetical protein